VNTADIPIAMSASKAESAKQSSAAEYCAGASRTNSTLPGSRIRDKYARHSAR